MLFWPHAVLCPHSVWFCLLPLSLPHMSSLFPIYYIISSFLCCTFSLSSPAERLFAAGFGVKKAKAFLWPLLPSPCHSDGAADWCLLVAVPGVPNCPWGSLGPDLFRVPLYSLERSCCSKASLTRRDLMQLLCLNIILQRKHLLAFLMESVGWLCPDDSAMPTCH